MRQESKADNYIDLLISALHYIDHKEVNLINDVHEAICELQKDQRESALQALTEQAQDLDMGYGKPEYLTDARITEILLANGYKLKPQPISQKFKARRRPNRKGREMTALEFIEKELADIDYSKQYAVFAQMKLALSEIASAIPALKHEIAQDKVDAERYRFLRDEMESSDWEFIGHQEAVHSDELIDEAMAIASKKEGV